jgi:UDP-N-acetylmuramoyl-tripeptide--D-alanyl-D-alanine ligase
VIRLTAEQAARAVNGRIIGDGGVCITSVVKDTDDVKKGCLFVCIKGGRFDGHNFALKAEEAGAAAILSSRALYVGAPQIIVENTRAALIALADWHRKYLLDVPLVAVTGSAGKTTTREMIASALKTRFNTVSTRGNLNNDIGLPLMLLEMSESTEAAVFEMGMNHAGEIDTLAKTAKPDIAVITNIGNAHVENLGSRENIFKAKTEVFARLKNGGTKILNGDDEYLKTVPGAVFYGFNNGEYTAADMKTDGVSRVSFALRTPAGETRVKINAPGRHIVYAALAAAAAAEKLGLSLDEIKEGLETFVPLAGRGAVICAGRVTIIDGSYNASPEAVKANIDQLAAVKGRKVCVLGEMKELGALSDSLHFETGAYAKRAGVDLIVCVGAKALCEGAGDAALFFEGKETAKSALAALIKDGDTVLVKASHSAGFGEIVDYIRNTR